MAYNKGKAGTLQSGHYLGLKFSDGWFFTFILETEYTELKPWTFLNENGNRAAIAAQTAGSKDDEIKNSVSAQLTEPHDDERNLIFQVRVGLSPSRGQLFPLFGRNRSPHLENQDSPGQKMVPTSGYDSPYNSPTDQLEFFNVADMPNVAYQAYNPMDEAHEIRASFHVNQMKYAVVTDINLMRAMIEGQQPAKLYAMGMGAQQNNQIRAPGWMKEQFGNEIHTTQEILNSGSSSNSNQSGGPISSVSPTVGSGNSKAGGS